MRRGSSVNSMKIAIHRTFHFFIGKKVVSASSQEAKKRSLKINVLHLGTKAKYIMVSVLIVIMIVSIFAFMRNATPIPDNITPVQTIDPTTSPSPTGQSTPAPTKKPTTQPATTYYPQKPFIPGYEPEPTFPPRQPGIIEKAQAMNRDAWKGVANEAWTYFKPGIGIDPNTGLPGSTSGYPYFTDWDLGVYIQAVIDAQKMGLITDPVWTANYRFDRVLTFLETRPLNNYSYPFWFYQAGDGKNYAPQSDLATVTVDAVDAGRLFVALNNLKAYNANFTARVDNIVLNGFRSDGSPGPNYAALIPDIRNENKSKSIYAYYYTSGFAAFWPAELGNIPGQILQNILNSPSITVNTIGNITGNVTLPNSEITCEPLLHAVFELNMSSSDRSKLMNFTRQVYLAHEELHNLTGQWVAFSEGNSGSPDFIYEWVVLPGVGFWKVTKIDRTLYQPSNEPYNPIIYSKVALSFLALYNTTYAYNLTVYLEKCLPLPTIGWSDGADYTIELEKRTIISSVGSNTNGMILSASRYFMQNNS